jgi:hypothetical protein
LFGVAWPVSAVFRPHLLKTFRITGLTEVFGIYETVDQAIAARRGRR